MKIAVFSDVHGNFEALNTVIEMIEKEQVDQTIFIGDIFQRGNREIECLEYLKNSDIICVKGNCELYIDKGVCIDPDVEYLQDYYDNMRERLTAEQREFIHELPLYYEKTVNGLKILFSHFLFHDIEADYPYYQLSDMETDVFSKAVRSNELQKYDLVVVGHAHKNFVNGKVVGVSATGIDKPTFVLIEIDGKVSYQFVSEFESDADVCVSCTFE